MDPTLRSFIRYYGLRLSQNTIKLSLFLDSQDILYLNNDLQYTFLIKYSVFNMIAVIWYSVFIFLLFIKNTGGTLIIHMKADLISLPSVEDDLPEWKYSYVSIVSNVLHARDNYHEC